MWISEIWHNNVKEKIKSCFYLFFMNLFNLIVNIYLNGVLWMQWFPKQHFTDEAIVRKCVYMWCVVTYITSGKEVKISYQNIATYNKSNMIWWLSKVVFQRNPRKESLHIYTRNYLHIHTCTRVHTHTCLYKMNSR